MKFANILIKIHNGEQAQAVINEAERLGYTLEFADSTYLNEYAAIRLESNGTYFVYTNVPFDDLITTFADEFVGYHFPRRTRQIRNIVEALRNEDMIKVFVKPSATNAIVQWCVLAISKFYNFLRGNK